MDVLRWLIGNQTYDNHDVDIEALKTSGNAGKAVMVNSAGNGVVANTVVVPSSVSGYTVTPVVGVTGGTAEMTGGTTALATGVVYLQYE